MLLNLYSKELHLLKQHGFRDVTELGMVMSVNEMHPSNALYPMVVTDFGMVMCVNELHPRNALHPIVVTESVMTMLFNDVNPAKALSQMTGTHFGTTIFSMDILSKLPQMISYLSSRSSIKPCFTFI